MPSIRNIGGGCIGGNDFMAYGYVKLFGISKSEQYPYTSAQNINITGIILIISH